MADRGGIEWTDATWNPVTGCTKLSPASPGCTNCYASTFAERFRGTPGHYFESGFDVQLRPDKLTDPLRWRKPRKVFVNSMSDLFHARVPIDYIIDVFAVMAKAKQHSFQLLTKRHDRMRSLLSDSSFAREMWDRLGIVEYPNVPTEVWPLPNVWLGVSTENQKWADIRIPALIDTPAAARFISAEPLLGPIDLMLGERTARAPDIITNLDWVIVGGESGRGARPMHPHWARSLRDQCVSAGVPFMFKQWGAWSPLDSKIRRADQLVMTDDGATYRAGDLDWPDGPRRGEAQRADFPHHHPTFMYRVGKGHAGRVLDGRTWDEYPTGVA